MPRLTALVAAVLIAMASIAEARVTLLRDADIEHALGRIAAPLLRSAGLNAAEVRVLVVDDRSLNAFVADTRHIFLHSGLIARLETAQELQAVIAHEIAHITGGHIARRIGNMQTARTAAGLGMLLGIAAGAASGESQLGVAVAAGSQGSAARVFLSHTRAEEVSADIVSVRMMIAAGIDPRAAIAVQEIFRGQEMLSVERQDPYRRTHPASRDRLRALEGLVAGQPVRGPDPEAEYWFARAKGKLTAFQRAPGWTLRRADDSPATDIRLMREAVAHHRNADKDRALAAIDGALAARGGNDPYLMDLRGQILLESRDFAGAVSAYRAAASAAPREALILGGLGRALLAADRPREALQALETARGRDASDARMLRDLAAAYARTDQPAMASLATAERYALQGRWEDAALHAGRASDRLPRGSGPWQRAEDVLIAAKRAQRR
jgi:predicted Zn-dependent protease